MSYSIVKTVENNLGQTIAIIGNGTDYFLMTAWKDGTYSRKTEGDMSLKTNDFDYAAIGAPKFSSPEEAERAV